MIHGAERTLNMMQPERLVTCDGLSTGNLWDPALRHRVAGVDRDIEECRLELTEVNLDRPEFAGQGIYDSQTTADRAASAEPLHAQLWPNNFHKIVQNRLALLGEESVSVGHRRHPLSGK